MRGRPLAGLLAAAVLAGCGAHPVADEPTLDEVAAATRVDPYRFELTLTAEGFSEAFTATATGAADPAADRGVIRYHFVDDGGTTTIEVRSLGDETYTRFAAPGLSGGGWTKESSTEADRAIGPFGMFSEPHNAADALARHGRDVRTGPGDQLDGIATTHYHATVPAIEILGAGLSKERRNELEAEIRESGSETADVEAWAGDDGVLRKLTLVIPIREDGEEGRLLTEARFFDFGEPVEVETPPASEIQESGAGLKLEEGADEPCRAKAAPHAADEVITALRGGGFRVTASCFGDDTVIFAYPNDAENMEDGVVCSVSPGPEQSRREVEDAVVAGNVACTAQSDAQREALTTLLDGL